MHRQIRRWSLTIRLASIFWTAIAAHHHRGWIKGRRKDMAERRRPRLALLFAQFSAYHVDRCEAVARRLSERFEVLAVEVATRSETYAWDPSGAVAGARKLTLFPGSSYDQVHWLSRLWAQFRALRSCKAVLIGIGYNEPDIVMLSWLLRLVGVQVVLMSESKFDDRARSAGFELFKALLLAPYTAAIVGGRRQIDYMRFLGFRRRPVLPGYDTVGLERVLAMGGGVAAPRGAPFAARPFLFVGRFVAKKGLAQLLEAYASYAQEAGGKARRLVLVGDGPDEAALRAQAEALGIKQQVEFAGFLGAEAVARQLADALVLVLVSREEQWGLVVNEALAFHLPLIVAEPVGSRDALVRNLVNGFVVEPGSSESLVRALQVMASSEAEWRRMVAASAERAWMGDCGRLADAAEFLFNPAAREARERIAKFVEELASGLPTDRSGAVAAARFWG
jgi:glycosyltransferase involved in cell wall biosynthesis